MRMRLFIVCVLLPFAFAQNKKECCKKEYKCKNGGFYIPFLTDPDCSFACVSEQEHCCANKLPGVETCAVRKKDCTWFKQCQSKCALKETQCPYAGNSHLNEVQCKAKLTERDCAFYDCFEKKAQCGEKGYLTIGSHLCARMKLLREEFTAIGKKWIDFVRNCTMDKLVPLYNTWSENKQPKMKKCAHVEETAYKSQCYKIHDPEFCFAVSNKRNLETIARILDFKDNWASLNLINELTREFLETCAWPLEQLQEFIGLLRGMENEKIRNNWLTALWRYIVDMPL